MPRKPIDSRVAKKTAPIAIKPEPPEWVNRTLTIDYTLQAEAWATTSDPANHTLELTVEEYEALKRHLARLRGFDVPEVAA